MVGSGRPDWAAGLMCRLVCAGVHYLGAYHVLQELGGEGVCVLLSTQRPCPGLQVMGSDICPDGSYLIASTGYDRTIKLFAPDALAAAAES